MKELIVILVISGSIGFSYMADKQPCCLNGEVITGRGRCGPYQNVTKMNCTAGRMVLEDIILDGDKVSTRDTPGYTFVEDVTQYCVGLMYRNESMKTLGVIPVALVCFEQITIDDIETSGILTLISAFFLIATLAVYAYLPQMRDLQGLCYMCMCASMALGFFFLGILQLSQGFRHEICTITGFLVYTWMMATFFWMNVICINMFRCVLDPTYMRKTERKQYLCYSCYAWGFTIVFLMVALITNFAEGKHWKPGFGNSSCWFNGRTETWIFFYGPIAILITANVVLFTLSSLNLWRQTIKYEVNKLNNLKHKFILSLKLFLVMGISWIFEIASFAHGESHIIWKIMDVFNCLQGVVIFILLVVLRKRAIQGLAKENFCLMITRPLGERLNPHDDTDDQHILGDDTTEFKMHLTLGVFYLLLTATTLRAEVGDTDLNELSEQQNAVKINKCCEHDELVIDSVCRLAEQYNQSLWVPQFKTEDGKDTNVKYFRYVHGYPNCETTQRRAIIDLGKTGEDKLNLLTDGRMQHLIQHEHSSDSIPEESVMNTFSLHDDIPIPVTKEPSSFIHVQDKYCMDKILITTNTSITGIYALVCVPEVKINWKDTNFLMKKIMNPLFHGIAMVLFLIVAIIYFVLPTLRDLAGNIITTIMICLIVSQAADLVRIFTEFSNHISFMITDIILYISLLSAFFWLNSFGFYIWKTFKSRNVFLRVTDVRKYCYYSSVVWSCVIVMAAMAICAHFLLDTGTNPNRKSRYQFSSSILIDDAEQETIGLLGIAIFFTPVAFTIIFNVFFYVTTLKIIKRINIYGRIHHKLKGCFNLFLQLFLIMTTAWIFLLLSWLNFDGLIYTHIFVNLFQSVLIFYVCVLRQSHVTFLLRKSCCYAEPIPTGEWGDEMTHMNGGNY